MQVVKFTDVEKLVAKAREEERGRCVKIVETITPQDLLDMDARQNIVEAIRNLDK